MSRHPLYDEFEKEGYVFVRIKANQVLIPKVFNENDLNDYCLINPTMTINGQAQIEKGPTCTQKTVQMLQRFLEVLNSCNGNFVDYE